MSKRGNSLHYKIHWHVIFTHFPISLFGSAFLFQMLHLFWAPACFELATNVVLTLGTISMIPAVLTGWRTWKRSYQGAHVTLFQRKIVIAFALTGVSIFLTSWRALYIGFFTEVPFGVSHWLYLAGNILLIIGAAAEGVYGGLLNHH